jgi:hypothetical protein
LGETLIGIFVFKYNPFSETYVEKVKPTWDFLTNLFPNENCNSESGNNRENICVDDFIKASQGNNALAMEISEVHFVLSRVFSGLLALSLFLLGIIFFFKYLPLSCLRYTCLNYKTWLFKKHYYFNSWNFILYYFDLLPCPRQPFT